MKNKLTDLISYDYLYCDKTYDGVFSSSIEKLEKDRDRFINNAKLRINRLKTRNEPLVIIEKNQKKRPILKERCCMAGLTSTKTTENGIGTSGSVLHIIWFDDGDMPIEESIIKILPEIKWEENAQNFDW